MSDEDVVHPLKWCIYWTDRWPNNNRNDPEPYKRRRVLHTRTDSRTELRWFMCITTKPPTGTRVYRVEIPRDSPDFDATGLKRSEASYVDCEDYHPLAAGEHSSEPIGTLGRDLRTVVMATAIAAALARMPDEE